LLIGERKRVARYRDTLGNLAHSFEDALAVHAGGSFVKHGVSEAVSIRRSTG